MPWIRLIFFRANILLLGLLHLETVYSVAPKREDTNNVQPSILESGVFKQYNQNFFYYFAYPIYMENNLNWTFRFW